MAVIFILFFIIILIILSSCACLMMNNNKKETMCDIEYPICDNYCQRAKYDLCVSVEKDGLDPKDYGC